MHHAFQKSVWMNSWQFWLFSTAQQYGRREEDAAMQPRKLFWVLTQWTNYQLNSSANLLIHRCCCLASHLIIVVSEAAHFSVMSWKLKWRDTDLTSCRCGRRIRTFCFSHHTLACELILFDTYSDAKLIIIIRRRRTSRSSRSLTPNKQINSKRIKKTTKK